MNKICVFCGSSRGILEAYSQQAEMLAEVLVENGIELVYGGANIGLMKSIADRVLALGGRVTGVMPGYLAQKEILHEGMTETILVEDMQERKKIMEELSDGFITMPGGFGTMDELFEMLSWNQLGLIHKPVGIFNIEHYFDALVAWLDHAVDMKFIRPEHRANILVNTDPEALVKDMSEYTELVAEKWVDSLKKKGY
ncbi:MAG: TIGR00730 family Rossman fold protein [Bacteroidales bacterium]|nr:TIGR00730 family Rossman fold protein [Bacteroidales bacterium]